MRRRSRNSHDQTFSQLVLVAGAVIGAIWGYGQFGVGGAVLGVVVGLVGGVLFVALGPLVAAIALVVGALWVLNELLLHLWNWRPF